MEQIEKEIRVFANEGNLMLRFVPTKVMFTQYKGNSLGNIKRIGSSLNIHCKS